MPSRRLIGVTALVGAAFAAGVIDAGQRAVGCGTDVESGVRAQLPKLDVPTPVLHGTADGSCRSPPQPTGCRG
jgi:hypothetical protein